MKRLRLLSGLFVLAALALAACGGAEPTPVTLTIDMDDFTFDPPDVTVPAGSQVTLNLSNSGTLEHEWVIIMLGQNVDAPFNEEEDEAKIYWEEELDPGETETLIFTAPTEPGTYQLVCGTPGHLEAGMEGTLTVTEP